MAPPLECLTNCPSHWRLSRRRARSSPMTPQEHDRRVALISHLPHALAAALVAIQDEQTVALAGKGFADATRIAAGDGVLWRDIFLDNADELRWAVTKLREQLDHLEFLLDPNRAAELKTWLDQIAQKR